MPALKGPLDGIRVVDMSSIFVGPLAAMYLGDLGADVIKVEHPRSPDAGRFMGTRLKRRDGAPGDSGVYYLANRNKRAVTINWSTAAGRETLLKLLGTADILIESFRPGTLANRNLDFASLKDRFPRLIYCHVSGFGYSGPYSLQPSHDLTIMAYTGAVEATGRANSPPIVPAFQAADICSAQSTVISLLAALMTRHQDGVGRFLDNAMLDSALSLTTIMIGEHIAGQATQRGNSTLNGGLPNYNVYRCADGRYIAFAPLESGAFKDCLKRLGGNRWATRINENPEKLRRSLARKFAQHPRAYWISEESTVRQHIAPVNTIVEALADPHLKSRNIVRDIHDLEYGRLKSIAAPFKIPGSTQILARLPPRLGEHNDEIFRELGFNDPLSE